MCFNKNIWPFSSTLISTVSLIDRSREIGISPVERDIALMDEVMTVADAASLGGGNRALFGSPPSHNSIPHNLPIFSAFLAFALAQFLKVFTNWSVPSLPPRFFQIGSDLLRFWFPSYDYLLTRIEELGSSLASAYGLITVKFQWNRATFCSNLTNLEWIV